MFSIRDFYLGERVKSWKGGRITYQISLCDDETAELDKTEELLNIYEKKHPGTDFMIERFESAGELLCMVEEKSYAPEAFDVDASQYLIKPVVEDKNTCVLDKYLVEKEGRDKYILLKIEGRIAKVAVKDVIYCEAQCCFYC